MSYKINSKMLHFLDDIHLKCSFHESQFIFFSLVFHGFDIWGHAD